jgi:hypothetical protein
MATHSLSGIALDANSHEASTPADAVKITLGPMGRQVVLGANRGSPRTPRTVRPSPKRSITPHPFADVGSQLVKQVAVATREEAGDGTTTAMVLPRRRSLGACATSRPALIPCRRTRHAPAVDAALVASAARAAAGVQSTAPSRRTGPTRVDGSLGAVGVGTDVVRSTSGHSSR